MNLDDLRVDVKQLKDDLLPIETNAQSGIDLAKARYEDAKAIQEDAIKIHDNNSKLVDEAVRFNLEIEDKIADARSALHKFEDGQNHLQETSANVSLKLQTCSDGPFLAPNIDLKIEPSFHLSIFLAPIFDLK